MASPNSSEEGEEGNHDDDDDDDDDDDENGNDDEELFISLDKHLARKNQQQQHQVSTITTATNLKQVENELPRKWPENYTCKCFINLYFFKNL